MLYKYLYIWELFNQTNIKVVFHTKENEFNNLISPIISGILLFNNLKYERKNINTENKGEATFG